MFLHVIEATHLIGHRVLVQFNNGTVGEADLIESLTGSVFEPLRDIEYFRRFSTECHTLTWPNGANFAPECLHALVTSQAVGTGRQTTIRRVSPAAGSNRRGARRNARGASERSGNILREAGVAC